MEGLTPGRNVHYVDHNGEHLAAIISGIQGTKEPDYRVRLHVLIPYIARQPIEMQLASYDPSGVEAGTWHFIERA